MNTVFDEVHFYMKIISRAQELNKEASHKHLEKVKYSRDWSCLQVECLIVKSRALHRYKGPTALTYYFQDIFTLVL